MGVLFDLIFDSLLEFRIVRWVGALVLSGLAVWFGGILAAATWIFIGAIVFITLVFELFGRKALRKREKS